MKYKISKDASADLRNIGRYTEKNWGKAQAGKYLDDLEQKFDFITANPLINRERTELRPSARIHHYEHHLIVYLLRGRRVFIVRVLHKNADIGTQLESTVD